MNFYEGFTLMNFGGICLAAGVVLERIKNTREESRREAARIEADSKARDAEIERRLEEGITDGDRSTGTRLDKLETSVERMEERLDERFEKMAEKIENVVSALSGKVTGLVSDVQKLSLTKQSNPRMEAQRGGGE